MEPTPLTDPERPPEHAFGRIHEITVPVEWAPTPKNLKRKVRGFTSATTQTWSVNGVGFSSTTDPMVEVGDLVTIRIGPVDGEVVVRTVHATDTPEDSYYGVEFLSDDLQAVARDLISIHLRHQPEERPQAASPLEIAEAQKNDLGSWT